MAGCSVDYAQVNQIDKTRRKVLVDLPSYPWMHKRKHWHESRLSKNHRLRRFPHHDLLGVLVEDFNPAEPRWRGIIRLSEIPWRAHHRVQSSTIFPLTGYLAMAIEATFQHAALQDIQLTKASRYELREISVKRSLVIPENEEIEMSLTLKAHKEGTRTSSGQWNDFCIYSWSESTGWSEHCHGLISFVEGEKEHNVIDGERHSRMTRSELEDIITSDDRDCSVEIDCKRAYNMLLKSGLEFGPTFRNIVEAQACAGRCIGTLAASDPASVMPHGFQSQYIVHPAILDSCLHPTFFASTIGNSSSKDLRVPTFVKAISVSHDFSSAPGHQLQIHSLTNTKDSGKDIEASLVVLKGTGECRNTVAEVKGLVASALPSQDTAEGAARGLCYKMQLEPCPDLLLPAQHKNSASDILKGDYDNQQSRDMERAALYYLQEALSAIAESEIDTFQPHHQRLYRCLQKLSGLGNDGHLQFQTPIWLESSTLDKSELLERLRNSDECGQLVCGMGENLPAILRQEIDPLSIMLKDGLLERFYRRIEVLQRGYLFCARWIGKFYSHQNPSLKVLEIGAGTGSATVPILEALSVTGGTPRFARYCFTDISAGFFERAREQLQKWGDLIDYGKLTIEEDPGAQGYEPESFDLVNAANGLHATAKMHETLRNTRKLLKAGGKLVFVETTALSAYQTITFGTLPGMSLFSS